jgi:hypothetical protein
MRPHARHGVPLVSTRLATVVVRSAPGRFGSGDDMGQPADLSLDAVPGRLSFSFSPSPLQLLVAIVTHLKNSIVARSLIHARLLLLLAASHSLLYTIDTYSPS